MRRTTSLRTGDAIVTKILVAINAVVFLITVAQGSGLNNPGGRLFDTGRSSAAARSSTAISTAASPAETGGG